MSQIFIWIRNIACFLCVFQMVLHVIPGNGYKRYVRFIGGILLIILVMSPLAGALKMSGTFEEAFRMEGLREELEDIRTARDGLDGLKSDKVETAFEEELRRQIEALVRENHYYPVRTSFLFEKKGDSIVGIEEVRLVISKKNTKIDIHVGKISGEEGSERKDVENLKKEIQEVYQIPVEHINIDVRE